MVLTHADDEAADLRRELLADVLGDEWSPHAVSVPGGEGLAELRVAIFEALDLVRVYTKMPGKKADMTSPFLLERGSTVMDLAEAVHKEIAAALKFARIWGQRRLRWPARAAEPCARRRGRRGAPHVNEDDRS